MTQLISDEYKQMNAELHAENKFFGSKGHKIAETVYYEFILPFGLTSILDYGCGKGTLGLKLWQHKKVIVYNYDPCYEKFANRPAGQFPGVVCSDVLEHIEEEFIDNVLDDIKQFGSFVYFLRIGLCPSNKNLPDGRNAHILLKPQDWWREKLKERGFVVMKELETAEMSKDPKLVFYTAICEK